MADDEEKGKAVSIMHKTAVLLLLLGCSVAFVAEVPTALAEDVPRMTKEQLAEKMGDANLVVIDVRTDKDWKGSEAKIKGAMRQDPKDVKEWAARLDQGKRYVLYCA